MQALTSNQLQVGVTMTKRFLKPGTKKTLVYFGVIDLLYDKSNSDFEDCCCHMIYKDDDYEDFSYSEFVTVREFFKHSIVLHPYLFS